MAKIVKYAAAWCLGAHCQFTLIDVESGYRGSSINSLYRVL